MPLSGQLRFSQHRHQQVGKSLEGYFARSSRPWLGNQIVDPAGVKQDNLQPDHPVTAVIDVTYHRPLHPLE
jgi:hypothetical protein